MRAMNLSICPPLAPTCRHHHHRCIIIVVIIIVVIIVSVIALSFIIVIVTVIIIVLFFLTFVHNRIYYNCSRVDVGGWVLYVGCPPFCHDVITFERFQLEG